MNSFTERIKDSTLVAVLLLDLFERIADNQPGNKHSWTSHVNGALAIVKVRGLEHFHGPSEYRILQRMSSNFVLGYVANSLPVPREIVAIRDFVRRNCRGQGAMQRFSDLMGQYASLRCDIGQNNLAEDETVEAIKGLDLDLQGTGSNMPPAWQYINTIPNTISDRIFGRHVDFYLQRNTCLAWNVLRVVRILLNEMLIKYYSALPASEGRVASTRVSQEAVRKLTNEVCASVPQYTDCDGTAQPRPLASKKSDLRLRLADNGSQGSQGTRHSHTPKHQADCYTLLFPLYVVGKVNAVSGVRPWAIKELRYMGSHFYIRNAELVAQLLERGGQVCPWQVYTMLGGYAFTV